MSQNLRTTFVGGKMNKSVDERLLPPGEYVDARNVRLGSTEQSEIGAVENSKGNSRLSTLTYEGIGLSLQALCIGAYEDGINETIYWFVHDPAHPSGKIDMIVSLNMRTNILTYHVLSETVLNFDPKFLITGVDKIDNLLFFTDDKNPPRVINVTRNYPDPALGVDGIDDEDINVIKKPPGFEDSVGGYAPLTAPLVALTSLAGDENYMKDRFISFAYRYRYQDGEYSATSLFTQPAFQPSTFRLNVNNYTNAGMVNRNNAAIVSFSTGSKRVVQVDVLYKESTSNQIYVIERFKKADYGWGNNETQSITFDNSKIYTVLGSDELLRLYDNVPHKAKAQTIQGNRLMYGNYVDQFDIDSSPGVPIQMNYSCEPISQSVAGTELPSPTNGTTLYDVNPTLPTQSNSQGAVIFDLSSVPAPIAPGTTFSFTIKIVSSSNIATQGSGPEFDPTYQTNNGASYNIAFSFTANQSYATVSSMLNSNEFKEAIGTNSAGNYQPVATADEGATLTDRFNASITSPLTGSNMLFVNSAIGTNCGNPTVVANCIQQGFGYGVIGGTSFGLSIPAVQYHYTDPVSGDVSDQWEYFDILPFSTFGGFVEVEDSLSLHSNRNYEVGVVYMDEYARASTVQVSKNNTVFFNPDKSVFKNNIRVTLENPPPYWAKKYKFVVKPSKGDYNTIIVNKFYFDSNNPLVYYFKLEADATSFIKAGDVLIVKSDSEGALNAEVKCTVLEVKSFSKGDIPGNNDSLPGVYMLIKPSGFSVEEVPNSEINYGVELNPGFPPADSQCDKQLVLYPLYMDDPANPGTNIDIDLPAGSTVKIRINNYRISFPQVQYLFDETFVASQDYANFLDFFNGEQIDLTTGDTFGSPQTSAVQYFNQIYNDPTPYTNVPFNCFETRLFLWRAPGSGNLFLANGGSIPQGGFGLGSISPRGKSSTTIEITRAGGLFVFETEPGDADPNFFYDTSEAFDIVGGNHISGTSLNDQNQDLSTVPATPLNVTIANANCYTFGNGVESFKIEDVITAKSFNLGERVVAVSNQDFSEADRFASMTYSGVIQPGANVNNLNEFNLGLVNYKDLESSFGPIMKLYSRETDILVLQEDRISYVLSGKNVITDSTGGGAIASVPEVLGTQIARIEEYGISFNPESFVSWGSSMFFTDVKRGAVLQLQGASANSDQLQVISEYGMRSFFRDQFLDQLETQKLGGYDPYMNEYVLCTNNRENVSSTILYECGIAVEQADASQSFTYDIDFGSGLGDIALDYTVTAGEVTIDFTWNGTTQSVTTTPATSTGTLTINKGLPAPTTATVVITPVSETATYELQGVCPELNELTVVKIVINGDDTAGQFTTFGYNWTNGVYNSPSFSQQTELGFVNPSAYQSSNGNAGTGLIPYNGVDLTMSISKTNTDTFVFNPTNNKFKYLSSPNFYSSAAPDIANILSQATTVALPYLNTSGDNFQVTIPGIAIAANDSFLYLVYDLRNVLSNEICYSAVSADDACCGCSIDCNTAFFGPVSVSQSIACNTDTNSPGAAQNSFQGNGNIPVIGDACFTGITCDASQPLAQGYYVVDITQPASTNPKNWIQVDAYGIVINSGTC